MDSLITAAARRSRRAIRWARSSAWRCGTIRRRSRCAGIAMAQLGDLGSSARRCCAGRPGVRRHAKPSRVRDASSRRPRWRSAARDLPWPARALDAARATLAAHGDRE